MNVRVTTAKDNNSKHMTYLSTDCEFKSPLSAHQRSTNFSPSTRNGYNLHFFNKEKAKQFFNQNVHMNMSNIRKRNKTPSQSKGCEHENKHTLPLSIRVTNIFNYWTKSKSKELFPSPLKSESNIRKEPSRGKKSNDKRQKEKEDSRFGTNKNKDVKMAQINYRQEDKQEKQENKGIISSKSKKVCNKRENNQFTVQREKVKSAKKKKPSFMNSHDNTLYASDIPDGIRKKMICYYQANTINYCINSNNHYQRSNLISNTEADKAIVQKNLGSNGKGNYYQLESVHLRNNDEKIANNSKLSNSTPAIAIPKKMTSKNKYRDLITEYLSEDENDM